MSVTVFQGYRICQGDRVARDDAPCFPSDYATLPVTIAGFMTICMLFPAGFSCYKAHCHEHEGKKADLSGLQKTGNLFKKNHHDIYTAGNLMRRKQIAGIVLALWFIIISVAMLLVERIDLVLFFVLGFIGFIVIVELMEPSYVKPGYLWYIRLLIAVGIVITAAIVGQKVLDIIGWEIVIG